ncbi:replication factor C subunit 1 isoform X2 [Nicotiana tabacum]|uniref:Replication factor C subunit 1 n=1 Tax=Nicotiana tabacum TaxID=4097 RepID=A0A1S3X4V3_TOBAC|nr:replication factor C subunit 1 isoform X2 [Nicotiana tomentosiformis]XP_016434866.1 PREDICTED: replication factor C subunit 1-like isoform X2 [Nicotiana tabacum]
MSDIRKWFMKQHDKGTGNGSMSKNAPEKPSAEKPSPENLVQEGQETAGRRKTSKYFATDKVKAKEEKVEAVSAKRKAQNAGGSSSVNEKPPAAKRIHKAEDDDDFVLPASAMGSRGATPTKKSASGSGRGPARKSVISDESDDDLKDTKSDLKPTGRGRGGRAAQTGGKGIPLDESDDDASADKDTKSGGRGRGGKGPSAAPSGGRGRGGGGRGGFMNFGERKDPPHKGEKEVPEGASNCLAGLTFVISGTLDSLEREEAEDLIKRHGGRVTGSVSKKTNYLLCDEDIEGRKSSKAKELGTAFLTEDGLFNMIRSSKKSKPATQPESKKSVDTVVSPAKRNSQNTSDGTGSTATKILAAKELTPSASPAKRKGQAKESSLPWTEKYRPKAIVDIIGNKSLVEQIQRWLESWDEHFLNAASKGKGKKQNDSGAKKAVLLSGMPGIGKTTSAKVVSQLLGFQTIEVNASDSRGKADSKIEKGIGGSTANSIKELVSNESLGANIGRSHHQKTVLIMDEVDGMSAGDRGGVADLIASIKLSKIPIICICNDRYSQKLKSLVNYCLPIVFRKPTKQQMAKRLKQVANAEGLQVNEIALEELAERVGGDMRMALNQLQYMSLSKSVIQYDDIRQRLLSSSKDEDISPFKAVELLFDFNAKNLKIDRRIDLSMSDLDLVPLLIQENYLNYKPSSLGKDDDGLKRMSLIARAADSIANGDLINVQIRRYQQWQLSPAGCLSSCIIPASLLHGQRQTLEQGERNFNRFGGWLGKNSTMGKNYRILEDLHVHLLASRESYLGRANLRLDYFTLLTKKLTDPLKLLPKDEAVENVVDFMDSYSISQDDFDNIVEISKFKGHPNPLDGVQPVVKAALTRAYNKGSKSRVIRTADLISLPGIKKAPKKRVAAMLEPLDEGLAEENGEAIAEDEENSSETEDIDVEKKLESDLQSLNLKGIQVNVDLKGAGGKKPSAGRGRGSSSSSREKGGAESSGKRGGRGSGATKRKR